MFVTTESYKDNSTFRQDDFDGLVVTEEMGSIPSTESNILGYGCTPDTNRQKRHINNMTNHQPQSQEPDTIHCIK